MSRLAISVLVFLTIFFTGVLSFNLGKAFEDRWWLQRVTGKDPAFVHVPNVLRDDVYCVRADDLGSNGFIVQPERCERGEPSK